MKEGILGVVRWLERLRKNTFLALMRLYNCNTYHARHRNMFKFSLGLVYKLK